MYSASELIARYESPPRAMPGGLFSPNQGLPKLRRPFTTRQQYVDVKLHVISDH
jgi:hypothetical protein